MKIDITERTFKFGVNVVNLINYLPKNPAGNTVAKQLARSGTSIGANIEEAQNSISKKEFIHSMNIGLKEARETYYWLKIIIEAKLTELEKVDIILKENLEIIKILTAIVKNAKKR